MKVHGLTVCVEYSDYLARSIDRWTSQLASLTIVTSMTDRATEELGRQHHAAVLKTDAFYADGAAFNKARAMEHGRKVMPPSHWHLLFDADVIPPWSWRSRVESADPQPGNIYGAVRNDEDDNPIRDGEMAGFFHLFAADDPSARRPLQQWKHAGGYDTEFLNRWPADRRHFLPLTLTHQGDTRTNWFGRGNAEAIKAMDAERRARGGYEHERMRA